MVSPGARALIEAVERRWEPLWTAVTELGPERLETATTSGWTAKELLAHVAFWDETVVAVVTMMFRGEELPGGWLFGSGYEPPVEGWPEADVHNEREAEWARAQSPEAVLLRCERAHEALLATLRTVTDVEAAERMDYFAGIGTHYAEHLPELEGLR